jgi:hypothetical protein
VAQLAITGTHEAHVCIIDQYVASGRTIAVAAELLYASGASLVTAIRGKWYIDALKPIRQADTLGLTSSHAAFMRDVGRLTAARSVARTN